MNHLNTLSVVACLLKPISHNFVESLFSCQGQHTMSKLEENIENWLVNCTKNLQNFFSSMVQISKKSSSQILMIYKTTCLAFKTTSQEVPYVLIIPVKIQKKT